MQGKRSLIRDSQRFLLRYTVRCQPTIQMQDLSHSPETVFSEASGRDFYANAWWANGSRENPHYRRLLACLLPFLETHKKG